MNVGRRSVLLLAALVPLTLALQAQAERLGFGLFGDTPYTDYERRQLPLILDEMGQANLAFAIHDGDIKNGASRCDDTTYRDILAVFQAAPLPLIYVPGDNEWTDCHRLLCGKYDPQERLKTLRSIFYADDNSLGQRTIVLERQSTQAEFAAYRENVRWEAGGALFVALNMPGPDNNVGHADEFEPRDRANLAWLSDSFRLAREKHLAGVLIAIQANPVIEADNEGVTKPGFKAFFDLLRDELNRFEGQVVLVHGDTHSMQINRPLKQRKTHVPINNFTRVETYGSPFLGWIRATVDTSDPQVFRFETRPWRPGLPYGGE